MNQTETHRFRAGLGYGVTAYGLWGLLPLYLKALGAVSAWELFAHRIVWSLLLLLALMTYFRLWPSLRESLRRPWVPQLLALSTLCIGTNWFCFIYGVAERQMIYTSLGYFITPLVNILLGMVFFGERLRRLQWLAVVLAAAGVACHTHAAGAVPVLSLTLACSFGLYGLLRKKAPIAALEGNTLETAGLFPLGVGLFVWLHSQQTLLFTQQGLGYDVLLIVSGPVTTLPLLAFAAAARRLPLSVLGMLQYLAPSLQFLQAVFLFGEPVDEWKLAGFAFIWFGLAVFTRDLSRAGQAAFERKNAAQAV